MTHSSGVWHQCKVAQQTEVDDTGWEVSWAGAYRPSSCQPQLAGSGQARPQYPVPRKRAQTICSLMKDVCQLSSLVEARTSSCSHEHARPYGPGRSMSQAVTSKPLLDGHAGPWGATEHAGSIGLDLFKAT